MSEELRRQLHDLSEDTLPAVLTPTLIDRAAASRRRRRTAGRVTAAAAGGVTMVTALLVALVVVSVLGPGASAPTAPAAAGVSSSAVPGSSQLDGASSIGEAAGVPPTAAQPGASPSSTSPPSDPEGTAVPPVAAPVAPATSAPDAPTVQESTGGVATATPTVTVPARQPVRVDAGGSGAQGFPADAGYSGGTAYALAVAVDTSGEPSTAAAVYQTVRYGASFDYEFEGLAPGSAHRLRLHWAELDFHAAGDRVFDVSVNGALVIDGMDVVKATGTFRRVVVRDVDVVADPAGRVVVEFRRGGKDNPFISGLELLPR